MRTQSNYMGKAKLQKKVLTTIMTGFLFAGISNTALADNVSVPDSKNDGQTIGAGNTAAGDGWSVEVGSDNNKSVYSVGDKNAISLRDNATIHIKKNAVVTNAANRNIGNFGTGANTIEVRSGSKITVDGTVQKYGPQNMGEAINVHGGGNTIVVNGSVIAEKSAAIWFQDWTGTGNDSRNSVINNGLIQRTDGGNVIGTSGGNGIDFTNNGTVNGSLFFAKGDDNLTFMPGSNVTGNIDGGGGKNKLNLDGGNDKVGGTLNGAIKNFTSLTKKGTGLWEITGPMQGFDTVDVQQGTLGLSGKVAGDVVNAGWLAPGSYNDKFGTFTVGGNYTGQPGGKLSIYSVLGGDASPTSKLVVEGDTEGSPTNIRVINQNGSGGYTDKGILIVDVQGKSDPNAFTLAYDYKQPDGTAAVAAGKYLYHLQYNQEDGDWYLKTLLNKDDTPVVNPSVPLYEAYPEIMLGYMKVNTLEERVGNRKWHIIEDGEPQQHLQYQEGTWFKTEGLSGKYKADRSTAAPDSSYDVDSWKMQMGYDKIISRQDAATTVVGGLNLQMGQARARIKSAVGNGKIKSDGKGLGGTMTWYKDNGVYVDTQAQAVWFDSDISSSSSAAAQQIEGNKGFGYGLSVETGKRIALKRPHWSWTPQMQLAYSNVDFDSFSDVNGLAVKRGSADSLQGRLGAALNYEKRFKNENDENYRSVKAYGLLNVYHEFHDGTNVLIAGDNFASKNDPTWLGLAVGGTYNYGRNSQYSLYGELGISTSAKNFGDSHVLRGEVGFRYRF